MVFKQNADALGTLQAVASPIVLLMNDRVTNLYLVVKSIDAAGSTVSKSGIYIDIKVVLTGKVQCTIVDVEPSSGTYYTIAPGDVVRLDKMTGASAGSLVAELDADDSVWIKQISLMAQTKINDLKTYWILAGIATSLGIAAVVSGISKANVDLGGFTNDGRAEMEEIVGTAAGGNGNPVNKPQ